MELPPFRDVPLYEHIFNTKILRFIVHQKITVGMLAICVVMCVISVYVIVRQVRFPTNVPPVVSREIGKTYSKIDTKKPVYISVHISGAVVRSGIYTRSVAEGIRLNDFLQAAGGLNEALADIDFIERNYNFARSMRDGEKVHFPTYSEVVRQTILEEPKIVKFEFVHDNTQNVSGGAPVVNTLISLNRATQVELESLPGIGTVTAQKIINSRPIERVNELVTRSIISGKLFDQIIKLISL